ncbi:hypothetical protein ACUODJ_47240, partial [Escherichia sp. HC-CC]
MLKHKIQTIFEALLYIMLTYWLIDAFFACNIRSSPETEGILQILPPDSSIQS